MNDLDSDAGPLEGANPGDLLPKFATVERRLKRQVGWFLLRASWGWGALLGAALIIRYLFDTLLPPTDYRVRAATLTYTIFGACLTAGFMAAWRTRSIRAGALTSFSAATIGALLSIAGTTVMLAIWHDPETLEAWRRSGGLQEAFIDVPLKLVAIGMVLGVAGALLGKGTSIGLPRLEKSA